jgi:hypothetical protein
MGDFVAFLPLHSDEYLDELSDLILLPVTQVMLPSIEIGSTHFSGKRNDGHYFGNGKRQVGRHMKKGHKRRLHSFPQATCVA